MPILESVLPFLLLKRENAEIAIEYQKSLIACRFAGKIRWNTSLKMRGMEMYKRCKWLNRDGKSCIEQSSPIPEDDKYLSLFPEGA